MTELHRPILKVKADFIDSAFEKFKFDTFADIGACWGVNGGYTFHILSSFDIAKAYIIDNQITSRTKTDAKRYPQLSLIEGDFGSSEIVDKIESIDAVIAYDILLHQVDPDWDEILDLYSTKAKLFIIYNQMFTGSIKTTRLIELGKEEYKKNTPYKNDAPSRPEGAERRIDSWFSKHEQFDPRFNKKNKDSPNFWQWGITDADLVKKMWSLGFRLDYMENFGKIKNLSHFENHGFLFSKVENIPYTD